MADQIEALRRLQEVDAELFRFRRQHREKPKELEAETARFGALEAQAKAAEDRVKSLQMAQKEKEIDLQTREGSVRKLQGQLFQLKTNKEYTTMQHEINTLKADNSLLEEAILRLLDEIDAAQTGRQEAAKQLAAGQARLQTERARIERETAELAERIAQLERQRQTLTPDVPREALSTYERILGGREGLALVPLMNESCGGCHRRLPPQVVNQVLLKAQLVTCESCNRILYFDEAHSKL
jgi:hypothetical protein